MCFVIHELQISFSWTGRTYSSSSSFQQSKIPLLSHCLSFIFPPYLLLSPQFMGRAAWSTRWQLHSAEDFCKLVHCSSTYKQNYFCWDNINLGKKEQIYYLHGRIYRLKIRMCQYYLHLLDTVINLCYLKVFLAVLFFQSLILLLGFFSPLNLVVLFLFTLCLTILFFFIFSWNKIWQTDF